MAIRVIIEVYSIGYYGRREGGINLVPFVFQNELLPHLYSRKEPGAGEPLEILPLSVQVGMKILVSFGNPQA